MTDKTQADLRAAIQAELDHAAINDHRLTPAFGKQTGEPAVRAASIEAVLSNPAYAATIPPQEVAGLREALDGLIANVEGDITAGCEALSNATREAYGRVLDIAAALAAPTGAAAQPAAVPEAVPGAVWEDGGVSLIRRGSEDARCASRGSERLYRLASTPFTTGWPATALMQDDSRELSRALSSKPDAKLHAREVGAAIAKERAAAVQAEDCRAVCDTPSTCQAHGYIHCPQPTGEPAAVSGWLRLSDGDCISHQKKRAFEVSGLVGMKWSAEYSEPLYTAPPTQAEAQVDAWTPVAEKLPPACQEVVVRGRPYGTKKAVIRCEFLTYISTRPRECVEDEEITHWRFPTQAEKDAARAKDKTQ